MARQWLGLLLCFALSLAAMSALARPQQSNGPLTDQDVLQMVRAGFDDTTILRYIQANDVDFDLSVSAMVALKNAGVSQSLIQSMLSIEVAKKELGVDAALAAIAATSINPTGDGVDVFVLQNGHLIPVEPETVRWRPSSGLRSIATFGMNKGPVSGSVLGPHSDLVSRWPPLNLVPLDIAFYVLCPKGSSASDFQLFHLSEKGDRREFRILTGTGNPEIARVIGGPENTVPFTLENVAPRVYKITLPNLNVGEYGFLAPTTEVRASSPSQGKMYTFRLVE
jgi:hypothetical protein